MREWKSPEGCYSSEDYTDSQKHDRKVWEWEKREEQLKSEGKPGQMVHPDDM